MAILSSLKEPSICLRIMESIVQHSLPYNNMGSFVALNVLIFRLFSIWSSRLFSSGVLLTIIKLC